MSKHRGPINKIDVTYLEQQCLVLAFIFFKGLFIIFSVLLLTQSLLYNPLSFQRVNITLNWNVTAVRKAWLTPLFHTPVRFAASTLRTAKPVLLHSCTAARRWRASELRDGRIAINWLAVRDGDEGWRETLGGYMLVV